MYIIYDELNGLYLLNAACCNMDHTYTCVWGEHRRDAKVFDQRTEAAFLAGRVSATAIVLRLRGGKRSVGE